MKRAASLRRLRWVATSAFLAITAAALFATACSSSGTTATTAVYTEPLSAPPTVPAPTPRGTDKVIVNLVAVEQTVEIAPGVTYDTWTFNGSVPGPMIRARVGETVEVHLKNLATNTQTHSIDLHAVTGPGGGAGVTTVAPGQEKTFTFKALSAGLFVYHCASGIVADHIASGMYGAILIDPVNGQDTVNHEYYVGQSEFYTTGATNAKGMQSMDMTKMFNEQPPYVVFNGDTKSLIGDKALQAQVGDTVRIYFANGGPNLTSSFHTIGEIFDKAWYAGSLESPPLRGIQTITVAPGSATIVEFKVEVPGDYKLVDHAIIRVSEGAVGVLHVTGAANPSIFNPITSAAGSAATAPAAASPAATSPAATATTAPATSPTAAASATTGTSAPGTLTEVMKDNFFETTSFTVSLGAKVTFQLDNQGKVFHNMTIAPADGNFDSAQAVTSVPQLISAGKTGTLTWQAPNAAGTFKFRCDVHPDQMTGTITVK